MSQEEIILERELHQGAGTRPPSTGAVPVLFGLRYISNPRIVWVKANNIPHIGTLGGVDPTLRDPQRFVLLAALCHGQLDSVTEIWCNGKRLHWNLSNKMLSEEKQEAQLTELEETGFFTDGDLLTGHCGITLGGNQEPQLGDAVGPGGSMGYLLKTDSKKILPENTTIRYNGIAMAHLYISQQGSDSFNNWLFLCKRFPKFDTEWQSTTKEITIGTLSRFRDSRERVRPRRFILAVDCTPINGIPVGPAEDTVPNALTTILAFREWNSGIPPIAATVSSGRFRYRYDVIRESVVKTLENFRKKLLGEVIGFPWNLKILLVTSNFRTGTTAATNANIDQLSATLLKFTAEGFNEKSVIPDNNPDNVDPVIEALIDGVQNVSLLREAQSSDPLAFHFWGQPSSHMLTDRGDFSQIVGARINKTYSLSGSYLPLGINAGKNPFETINTDIHYPFFQWDKLFEAIAANLVDNDNPTRRFDGFTADQRMKPGNEDILPQISIITGPTWPFRNMQLGLHMERTVESSGGWLPGFSDGTKYRRYFQPNIDYLYHEATVGINAGLTGWGYGERRDPSTALGTLQTNMGYGTDKKWFTDTVGNEEDTPRLIVDFRYLDPYVWGDRERYYASASSTGSGFGNSSNLTVNNAFPLYHEKLLINSEGVKVESPRVLVPPGTVISGGLTENKNPIEVNATASTDESAVDYVAGLGNNMGLELTKPDYTPETVSYTTANPVHAIRECLLNKDWGRGRVIGVADLDDGSFTAAATQVHKEKLGIGYLWDRQGTLDEVINDLLRHIDGVMYERDGKIYLKLVGAPEKRDDSNGKKEYFRNPVAITTDELTQAKANKFDTSNTISVTNFVSPREDELVNRIVLQYTPHYSRQPVSIHRENDYRIAKYGLKSKTVNYKGIIDKVSAGKVADRDLIEEESGLISCNINVLPEMAVSLNPNDMISLKWEEELNIREGIFRIVKIRYGDSRSNRTTLSVIQAVPGDIVSE